ncbi:hypothetical protein [Dyella japonica]|uniref:Uncharacterized protein n=1 Tax=Dyella japonica TaxID=231455 RepID=A0ABV2JWX8_9GAMM
MTMGKGWMQGLASVALLVGASVAVAGANKDTQAAEREAYVKAAGHAVAGIPDTARITSVDSLGDHRVAFYTVDGSHKDVWLVTTNESCAQPMLSGNRIVSLASGAMQDCQSVAIQAIDKRDLASRLRALPHGSSAPHVDAPADTTDLRFYTVFRTNAMTDGGRTQ